ncbi:MAG: hypothetical protein ACK40O_02660 [Allosphingosinicella sp.]
MKTIILALAATSALGLAAPAAAQSGYANVSADVARIQAQLQAGVRSGAISRSEAVPLHQQLRALTRLERDYAAGGFTRAERNDLRRRAEMLRQDIRIAAQSRYGRDDDRWDRDDRDGRWDRDCPPGLEKKNNGCLPPGQVGRDDRDGRWDDRDDRTGGWIDRNRDGYDDRDLNRDRRVDERERRIADERGYDDRDYDRDGDRYEDRRGGLGGLVDDIVGGRELRVGQRAGADLRVLSSEQRRHYRDGDGRYYRTDGRRIYEIDARTQTVVRIFPSR